MAINILKICKSVFTYVKIRSFPSHIRSSFPWRPPLAEILDPRLPRAGINKYMHKNKGRFNRSNRVFAQKPPNSAQIDSHHGITTKTMIGTFIQENFLEIN